MKYDITIIGGGVLGVSTAYWLSELYDAKISVLEKNVDVAMEASSRNTGNVHRPFYLDPSRRKKFAVCAELGYHMWKQIAEKEGLPWQQVGNLYLAVTEDQIPSVEKYRIWSEENGMDSSETELIYGQEAVNSYMRLSNGTLRCSGALVCKTDTAVDFGEFTRKVRDYGKENGVSFLTDKNVRKIKSKKGHIEIYCDDGSGIETGILINCAGGNAVDIAHEMGIGLEYTDLHFRGDFWEVDPAFARQFKHMVYTVPKYPKFQFLDPHLIPRADGRYEIGPSAVLVAGPQTYVGIGNLGLIAKLAEPPISNKIKLLANREFLELTWNEWMHLSRGGVVKRMQTFMPSITEDHILGQGRAGIRNTIIAPDGSFVPEAAELYHENSAHVIGYNSPGATGALAYAAYLVSEIGRRGMTSQFSENQRNEKGLFDFDETLSRISSSLE